MNTPAHLIINLFCLGQSDQTHILTPVIIGAILPDAPMFVFYFVEKVIKRQPESIIWSQAYYQPHWQNLIDFFNSVPLILAGFLLCIWLDSNWGKLFFASMMLHILGDFPLHHDDAHRHFLPFTHWRFISPISYWDPRHHGHIISRIEILTVIITGFILMNTYQSLPGKLSLGMITLSYLVYFIYVFIVWV